MECQAKQNVWPGQVMDDLSFSESRWLSRVPVFATSFIFMFLLLSAFSPLLIKQKREARKLFRQ